MRVYLKYRITIEKKLKKRVPGEVFLGYLLKQEFNKKNYIFNQFGMQKVYGKEVLHDVLRCPVKKLFKKIKSIDFRGKTRWRRKKQDGQNGPQTDPMGQYFAMGTIKFVY